MYHVINTLRLNLYTQTNNYLPLGYLLTESFDINKAPLFTSNSTIF